MQPKSNREPVTEAQAMQVMDDCGIESPIQREVYGLWLMTGFAYSVLAEMLGRSPASVRNALARAKQQVLAAAETRAAGSPDTDPEPGLYGSNWIGIPRDGGRTKGEYLPQILPWVPGPNARFPSARTRLLRESKT